MKNGLIKEMVLVNENSTRKKKMLGKRNNLLVKLIIIEVT